MQDGFGRNIDYLRVSVTDLCDLRCRYCMPEEGIRKRAHGDMLTEEEIVRAVEAAASLGVKKVRITGGEPLVKKNILSICSRVSKVKGIREVALTTNGTRLKALAKPLREAGVSRVNFSLDTLDADKYAYITRCGSLPNALDGLDAALSAGFDRVKLNAVLLGGFNDDEIPRLAKLTQALPVDVRFIEWMPMQVAPHPYTFLSADAVLEKLPALAAEECTEGVARLYRLPKALGCVGLIRPISAHFCASCNRLRLTADGKIRPCLHSEREFDIKGLDDEGMRQRFIEAIAQKPEGHRLLSEPEGGGARRTMNRIGG